MGAMSRHTPARAPRPLGQTQRSLQFATQSTWSSLRSMPSTREQVVRRRLHTLRARKMSAPRDRLEQCTNIRLRCKVSVKAFDRCTAELSVFVIVSAYYDDHAPNITLCRAASLTLSPRAEAARAASCGDDFGAVAQTIPIPAEWALQPALEPANAQAHQGLMASGVSARTSAAGALAQNAMAQAENLPPNPPPHSRADGLGLQVRSAPLWTRSYHVCEGR